MSHTTSLQQTSRPLDHQLLPILLSEVEAAACLGISERKFAELRKAAWMPKPIALGRRLLRWSRLELEEAVKQMPRQEVALPEPRALLRGKIERMKAGVNATGRPAQS